MKSIYKILLLTFISIFFLQCSPTLNYLGNNYTPTTNVSIFFDADDIQEKYKVMGLLNFNFDAGGFNLDKNETTDLILNKAKEVGADGVLITKFSNEVHQELSENINTKKVETKNSEKVFIEAKFLKFEK